MKILRFIGCALALVIGSGCSGQQPAADPPGVDLVVLGNLSTMDQEMPKAQAMAIDEGTIVAIGSRDEVLALAGTETETLELKARQVALPGFIDAHTHPLKLGRKLANLSLESAETWEEIVELVAAQVAMLEPGEWVLGRGWHQEKWRQAPAQIVDGLPTRASLDAISPDNPVYLRHASGHLGAANGFALDLAGLGPETADPADGRLIRDAAGELTGMLWEDAELLLEPALASTWNPREIRGFMELAGKELLRHGVTSIHAAGLYLDRVEVLHEMATNEELGIRIWAMLDADDLRFDEAIVRYGGSAPVSPFFHVGGIKAYGDGALGVRGAWLLEPYSDEPGTSGSLATPLEAIEGLAITALGADLQLAVHTIGDRANREVLEIFARALDDTGDHRWRIEHAQHLHPLDVDRFAEIGVIASMQPTHCTSDAPWVPARLEEPRAGERSYLWRSLLDAGVVIASGTDTPVESANALATLAAAVTRRPAGLEPFHPEQAMTVNEALRSMTIDAAFAARQDSEIGSLTKGKRADFIILDRDPMKTDPGQLGDIEVLQTRVDGKVAFSRAP